MTWNKFHYVTQMLFLGSTHYFLKADIVKVEKMAIIPFNFAFVPWVIKFRN